MPSNYRYPSKADFESKAPAGRMNDANESVLYRQKMESDLLGSTKEAFKASVSVPSPKGSGVDSSIWKLADDNSIYNTAGK
jgi:hypothetical protein|tara:strand:+ start:269 stop:511 length:243 start_codon:yes stop_codon:yes gene_type:complete